MSMVRWFEAAEGWDVGRDVMVGQEGFTGERFRQGLACGWGLQGHGKVVRDESVDRTVEHMRDLHG